MKTFEKIKRQVWSSPGGDWTDNKAFVATWRIMAMQQFDSGHVDLCGPAKLRIMRRGNGRMHFGAVDVDIEGQLDDLNHNIFHFAFEGEDDGDPICGRAYCLVDGDEMVGRIFFIRGISTGFIARREKREKDVAA